jgi:hypothetical protein
MFFLVAIKGICEAIGIQSGQGLTRIKISLTQINQQLSPLKQKIAGAIGSFNPSLQ